MLRGCSGLPLALFFASLLLPAPASASGYGVREWSSAAMGASYAGASATGSDASFLAYNPATLAGVGGLSTDYEDGWAGRYYALKSELLTVDAVPMVSYQFSDRFAVAAGLQI